ncbi:MAG: iron chelate uptake ABC transporter family permease subunit, partial [Putridiphycobacter sp.]|nr:iron chelate uptake ABC transporter family permease subunit [Putridiphycobacter sp.]
MTKSKNGLLLLLLSVILLSLSFFSVKIGEVALSSIDILDALLGRVADNPTVEFIVNSRLNRTVVAVLAGGALAVSGLILQVFFRNPLAGPGVLGISSGAALGVAVVLLGGVIVNSVSGYTLTIFAGVSGALLVLFLLLMMSRYIYQMVTLLVIGLMLSYFSSALLNILFQWADTEATRAFVVWSLGSFEGLTTNEVGIFTLVILSMLGLSFVLVKPLNALALGPEYATSLGINLRSVRFRMILITGVLTA